MATFEKKTWADRVSEFPTRRTLTDVSTGTSQIVTVARTEGEITNPGDPFNAQTMNDLEDRIDAVVQEMDENFQAGVDAVYQACVAEGVTPSASTPTAIAQAIAAIRNGGNAGNAQILSGYTAYSGKQLRSGSMINRGAWSDTGTGRSNVTIPQGYHNGSGYVNGIGKCDAGRSQGRADKYPYNYDLQFYVSYYPESSVPYPYLTLAITENGKQIIIWNDELISFNAWTHWNWHANASYNGLKDAGYNPW